ncbi:MAG: transcription antitermination factor NusB [Clostridia bacterium]|nr:transcription antitermination factor NusB [Clostridia bacterium]
MKRSEAREQAFILVFEKGFRDDSVSEIIEAAILARQLEENAFMRDLAEGTFEHIDEIDALIEKNCIGWKLERISRVALAILRLCCYELKFRPDIPVGVSIDQAVELAKKFATTDDASYINGVLGSVSRTEELEKQ